MKRPGSAITRMRFGSASAPRGSARRNAGSAGRARRSRSENRRRCRACRTRRASRAAPGDQRRAGLDRLGVLAWVLGLQPTWNDRPCTGTPTRGREPRAGQSRGRSRTCATGRRLRRGCGTRPNSSSASVGIGPRTSHLVRVVGDEHAHAARQRRADVGVALDRMRVDAARRSTPSATPVPPRRPWRGRANHRARRWC